MNKSKTHVVHKSDRLHVQLSEAQQALQTESRKHRAEHERILSRLSQAEQNHVLVRNERAKIVTQLMESQDEVLKAHQSHRSLKQQLELEMAKTNHLQMEVEKLRNENKTLRTEQTESVMGLSQLADQIQEHDSQLQDCRDCIEPLESQNQALVQVGLDLAQEKQRSWQYVASLEQDVRLYSMNNRYLREDIRYHQGELEDLNEEVLDLFEQQKIDAVSEFEEPYQDAMDSCESSMGDSWIYEREHTATIDSLYASLRAADRVDLDCAQDRINWLQQCIQELHSECMAMLTAHATHTELQRSIDKLKGELATVEEAYEAGILERIRAQQNEQAVLSQLAATKDDITTLHRRIDELEKQKSHWSHARMREDALIQEKKT